MADKSSSSVQFKLLWQGVLILALVAIVWVVAQALPGAQQSGLQGVNGKDKTQINVAVASSVRFYTLPRMGDSSALQEINTRLAGAQKEVIIVARQLAATSLLTNLKARSAAGVKTLVLLSPDMTVDFGRSKLFEWLRDNQLKGVYRDVMNSSSHMIVIDSKTVIVSDLPLSQRAFEVADEAAARSTGALGFVYIIDDAQLATRLAEGLRQRALIQNKIL